MSDLLNVEGFDWDEGNIGKNWGKHHVADSECEQVFFNEVMIYPDIEHSRGEERFYALGRADTGRLLFVSFTVREKKIRVISARNMTPREKRRYHDG